MQTLAHGTWPSPLDARQTLAGVTRRSAPRADGDDLYWLEARPQDAGRVTLVRRRGGGLEDVSLPGQNVRTGYLEYGGGEHAAVGGVVVWVDFDTQQVWRCGPGEDARPITPHTSGAIRWSCFRLDLDRGALFCLREDQRDDELEPVNSLVRLDLDGQNADLGVVLVAGRRRVRADRARAHPEGGGNPDGAGHGPDFVLDPVLSPDGRRIAWLTWDHPLMPWQGTMLWSARLDEAGDVSEARVVAGGAQESVEQPLWWDDSTLLFLSDRSGWSNLWRVDVTASDTAALEPAQVTDGQFDLGLPRWVPDLRAYAVLGDGRVVSGRSRDGFRDLVVIDVSTGGTEEVETGTAYVRDLTVRADGTVAVDASRADAAQDVLLVHLPTGQVRGAAGEGGSSVPDGFAALPEPVSWASADGERAHGFLYRPVNPQVRGPEGEFPPLIVTLHGGPTACAVPGLSAARTFWTSRGFAVLDVNYGGSTGYGRAYRERLDGRWGIVDVQDAATGAQHLADAGIVYPARLVITGGSAGGFTTLAAATFTNTFAAGASHFGISDLATLATDTHKLESRYCDGLVAPWPEGEQVYAQRSPIWHVDRLATPLILLQGTEDRVVPPDQAEQMAAALREKGLAVALVLFEGEGHGFRVLDSQVRALEAELSFYAQVFGLQPAGDLEQVLVENLG